MQTFDRTDLAVQRATSGMRRVDCIHMVEGARVRFFVEGVGHRFPARREVTAEVANALMQELPCRHDLRRRDTQRTA